MKCECVFDSKEGWLKWQRDFKSLGPRDVSNCIQRGGTLIHTSRCEEFRTEAGIRKAAAQLNARNVDVLLAIIALEVGITGGAEEILVPEETPDLQSVCDQLCAGKIQGKTSSLMIVAEGAYPGGVKAAAEELKKLSGNEYRLCVLGHVQRGGSPTAADRLLGTRLGAFSVEAALEGAIGKMVGEAGGKPGLVDLLDTFGKKKPLDRWMAGLVRRFSI